MRRLAIAAALCCLFLAPIGALADTGTYKIAEYDVKLTPRSDGTVEIEYHQKWNVTSGYIPWITVGVPSDSFQIVQAGNKGAIRSIAPDSSGGSYVRIDLDRDYKPGESFDVRFAIVQRRLFYANDDNYKMDFTPGWYDNAETGKLQLEVFFFAKLDTVTAEPGTFKQEGQSLVWERTNLSRGEKFSISVSFPKKAFPKEIPTEELKSRLSDTTMSILEFLLVGAAAAAGIVIVLWLLYKIGMFDAGSGYGGGGGIYSGGGGGGRSGRGGIFSGGGGGFGGAVSSCACACVSCACACACAGGGGAGCDRKLTHRCPLCRQCSRKRICPIFKGTHG